MEHLLQESKEIFDKAVADFNPYAIVVMVSGGDDSLTTLAVAKRLGIKVDFVIHGNTRTGLPAATDFVRKTVADMRLEYLEADAGSSYEDYVLRKGFFGKGVFAHSFAYHILKQKHFRKAISHTIRHKKRNRNVLCLNGVRVEESTNRADNFADGPYRRDPGANSNVWVNLIHNWEKTDCLEFLHDEKIERSPVSKCLGRSGECMCGTMQNLQARQEAAEFDPAWGKWIDDLERKVLEKFPWGWGQNAPKNWHEGARELSIFEGFQPNFQPACVGCKSRAAGK